VLRLDAETRTALWRAAAEAIEAYYQDVGRLGAAGDPDPGAARAAAERFDFDHPVPPEEALAQVVADMRRFQPHVVHPRHFGLFDPPPTAMGVVAEALAAGFNPCLASRAGSPFGVAAERILVERFGQQFGYPLSSADGLITSGGSEGNLTGVLLALAARFPSYRDRGLRAVAGQPVIYTTRHAHPSMLKAAAVTGLGTQAVHEVPVDRWNRMDAVALDTMIRADQGAGRAPLMVVATAGSTDCGVIDPIGDLADLAAQHKIWMHLDAAWGGALALVPEFRGALSGSAQADSITFDPHKWLSIPKECGLLLTRHPALLDQAFAVTMPFLAGQEEPGADPHTRSVRWSRGFAGLKLLLSMAVAGWQGYQDALRRQVVLGRKLRDGLRQDGWVVTNDTPLPLVCFTDGAHDNQNRLTTIADAVNRTGEARIFTVRVGEQFVLRACVTNYATTDMDIDLLIKLLSEVRAQIPGPPGALDPD
jgi:glutamate/tyrosine decarboxylase-like PLP-dependent enzyme